MKKLIFILILVMLTAAQPVSAHPHLFITPSVGFVTAKGNISGLRIKWAWDEWWSEDVMAECDLDGNGSFNEKEIKLVKSGFFDGAENFNYFLKVTAGGKRVKTGKAKNFTAKVLPDGTVVYEFTLDMPIAAQPGAKIEICFADETIYTAFEEKVGIMGEAKFIKKRASSPYGDYGVKLTLWL